MPPPPESVTPSPSPEALSRALRSLPARPAAFLSGWLLRGRSLEQCAEFYGISPGACRVHLLRAALALSEELGSRVRAPADGAEEEAWARGLLSSVESMGRVDPSLEPVVELCRRLREVGPQVVAALEAAEQEEERSPRRQREEWLRRLVVLVVLALTAFFYWR